MSKKSSKIIGLTGGPGSGKSTVAAYLGERSSFIVIDADAICKDLLMPRAPGLTLLRKELGATFFHADGSLNRENLREKIFQESDLRLKVNAIIHPLARDEMRKRTYLSDQNENKSWLVEVPLLFEAGWEEDFDTIIVVYASFQRCMDRLAARDKITLQQAKAMMAAQMSLKEKVLRADHVIDNSGLWADTCLQMDHLLEMLS